MDMGQMFTWLNIILKTELSHFLRWRLVSFVPCRRNSYEWSSAACRRDFQEKPTADTPTFVYLWVYDMYDMDDYWVASCFDCHLGISQEQTIHRDIRYIFTWTIIGLRENLQETPSNFIISWGKAWFPVQIFPSTNPMIFSTSWWRFFHCFGPGAAHHIFGPSAEGWGRWILEASGWTLGWKNRRCYKLYCDLYW